MADLSKYQPTIGIECHVQLKTKTKLFARVSNDARTAEPNTTVSPICFGLPGVLPYLNQEAVQLAIRAGLALNAKINTRSTFDRKHYFYPDLPKGYQITQYAEPIVGEGFIDVPLGADTIRVGIERAHLEEDAGKLTHPAGADYSLVDLNRAGTPLLEIVGKPDIHSAQAAKAYARELYLLMKYAGVSDVDLYHGHMRFDVNISVSEIGSAGLGTRTEVKNLNSFRAVEKAAQYEFERQVQVLEKGEKIIQETRGWDDVNQRTFSQRSKEEAHDYRYFPEPDLPPIELKPADIERIKKELPAMPQQVRYQLKQAELSSAAVEAVVDNPAIAGQLMGLDHTKEKLKLASITKWYAGPLQALKKKGVDISGISFDQLAELYDLRAQDQISSSAADSILAEMAESGGRPAKLAEQMGLVQISSGDELEAMVAGAIADNPRAAADIKAGEAKAVGFLVGQVMKASRGQANPKMVQDIIKKQLGV